MDPNLPEFPNHLNIVGDHMCDHSVITQANLDQLRLAPRVKPWNFHLWMVLTGSVSTNWVARRRARKQLHRKFASGHPPTKANTAKVQLPGLSPKVSFHPRPDLQRVQFSTSLDPPVRRCANFGLRPIRPGRRRPSLRDQRAAGRLRGPRWLACQFQ
jgi:hypothetical protein